MRALYCSAPLPGHLDWGGFLRTAVAQQQAGDTVLWASGAAVAASVAAAGVPFAALAETGWRWPPPPPLPAPAAGAREPWQTARAVRALDQWLDEQRVAAAVDALTAAAESFQPDLIVSEMFVAAAGIVAERLGVPFVVGGWPATVAPAVDKPDALARAARDRLERLLARWQLAGVNWTSTGPPALRSPRLHLTYWCATWYRGLPLAPQTIHVGGRAAAPGAPLANLPDPGERPWVLITLGTSFDDDPAFFTAAASAADRLGCLPLLVGSRFAARASAHELPASSIVLAHVDFAQVLPYCAAAIHHGGAGTTHALALHAVPQIVTPHAADQIHQARGVERSGVGLHMPPRTVTADRLAAALAQLLPDLATARAAARRLQAEMAALGGAEQAVKLLQDTARGAPSDIR